MAAASTDPPAPFRRCSALPGSDGAWRLWKWDCNNHWLIVRLISFSLSPISPCKMVENKAAECCWQRWLLPGWNDEKVCACVCVCLKEAWCMSARSPRNVDHRRCPDVRLCCLSALRIKLRRKRVVYELYRHNINSLDALLPSIQKKNVISIWKDYRWSATNYNPCCSRLFHWRRQAITWSSRKVSSRGCKSGACRSAFSANK